MEKIKLGFALCGSYCTYDKAFSALIRLTDNFDVRPIMSENAAKTDSRFGKALDHKARLREITGKPVIESITDAEPVGPQNLFDALLIAPCTGNTLAKLARGITDSSVTMAAKAQLRNEKPLIIAVSTNDGLSGSFKNIASLYVRKNIYFVPFFQDDPIKKPASLIADFNKLEESVYEALSGRQLQPLLLLGTMSD